MQETGRRAVGCEPDEEHGLRVVEREERVERHREAALGLVATPLVGHRLELLAHAGRDLARTQRARREAGVAESVHRLADLSDRPVPRARSVAVSTIASSPW